MHTPHPCPNSEIDPIFSIQFLPFEQPCLFSTFRDGIADPHNPPLARLHAPCQTIPNNGNPTSANFFPMSAPQQDQPPKPFKDAPPSAISGYVGWLTPEETDKLESMKTQLAEKNVQYENDQELLRFLRARKFDLPAAVEMFEKFKQWYAEFHIAKYPDEFPYKARALGELVPSAFFGFDREGHPVQIERTGKMDVPTVLSAVDDNSILLGWIWGQQLQIRRCKESTEKLGLPEGSIERFTQLLDLDGLSMSHLAMQKFLTSITKCGEANFPERLSKTIIVNYGWTFSFMWSIVKLTLDPVTREKIIVCPSLAELHKYIDPSELPKRYGGTQEDPVSLADPDVDALRTKYLNDDNYKDHYQVENIEKGITYVKKVDVALGRQYSYCFRCNEEVKFKAVFIPTDSTSADDHIPVSNEAKVDAHKWPCLGTFSSSNDKTGVLEFSFHNDNWWGAKELKLAIIESDTNPVVEETPAAKTEEVKTEEPKVVEEKPE